jgi:RimJ/RimL family protein N-acetyltransferase
MAVLASHPDPAVRLRPAVPRDAELLRRWRGEPAVRRFQPLSDLSVGQLRNDIASHRLPDLYRGRGEEFQWIIEVDGRPAGWITLVVSNWEHGLAEVGYALTTPHQGSGVMTQALGELVRDLFSRTVIERLEARCAVENTGSARVLEKLGFVREGRLRRYFRLEGERVDNYLYALLKSDYLS